MSTNGELDGKEGGVLDVERRVDEDPYETSTSSYKRVSRVQGDPGVVPSYNNRFRVLSSLSLRLLTRGL